jgi:transcriptional regulator GlxA family with amidase domain
MHIAYIVFNGITWLDLIGVYDPISRLQSMQYLPHLHWDICAFTDTAKDPFGMEIKPTHIRQSLSSYDAIIVPGGFGTRQLQHDPAFMAWLKTAANVPYKIAVCTGSLLLGAAGFLTKVNATTNFGEYEALRPYCKNVLPQRIVQDHQVITAGAVTASLDLGLYLCEKWAGITARETISKKMDYKYSE